MQQYFPPVAIDFLLKLNRGRHGFVGNFYSWDDAMDSCRGYESEDLVLDYKKMHSKLFENFRLGSGVRPFGDRDLRLISAVQLASKSSLKDGERLKILDFGGAYGMHYPLIHKFFWEELDTYIICESPVVSEAFNEFGTEDLVWISDLKILEREL